ncbi:MAG: LuxR family transcriptional regulator [Pseudomonadota bacterium]
MLQHLLSVVDAQTIEDVWEEHIKHMADFGFDRLLYGYTSSLTESSFGDPEDILILSNHEPDYVKSFMDDGLYFHAPMVRWAMQNVGSCSWRWIAENSDSLSPSEQSVVRFNRSWGVVAGYSISFRDSSARAKGAIALTARRGMSQDEADAVWAEHGDTIELCNKLAHLKISSLPHAAQTRMLTKRQREVLEWVGDGKTVQDIALLLNLTPQTVEKHLRLAREALDVHTTAQAVLKATRNRQIFMLES